MMMMMMVMMMMVMMVRPVRESPSFNLTPSSCNADLMKIILIMIFIMIMTPYQIRVTLLCHGVPEILMPHRMH